MGFNLTNEQIKDTYEQLVQISASALVDGTGSLVDSLDYVTNPTFTSYTSSTATSTSASIADLQTQINSIEAGSGSADWPLITNKPAGLVSSSAQTIANLPSGTISGSSQVDYNSISNVPSGLLSSSAQIADDISGSFTSTSASIASDVATNKSDISTLTAATSSYLTSVPSEFTASSILIEGIGVDGTISGDGGTPSIEGFTFNGGTITAGNGHTIVGEYSTYGLVRADNTESPSGLVLASDSSLTGYIIVADDLITANKPLSVTGAVTASNALISGDLVVNGTASFGYLQSVTGSAKIVGDAFIQVNTDTPALRYAGLQVVDSGSTANTASFIWDSQNNDFFYEYEGDDTDYGVFLIGPEYGTKGSPTYNASNKLVKGTGGHHLVDSSITDTGTSVSMSAPLTASGFQGDLDGTATSASFAVTASYALNAEGGGAGLVAGTGTDSIKSSDDLTTNNANAAGNQSIAIGDNAQATQQRAVAIGEDNNATGAFSVAIGYDSDATNTYCIAIGRGAAAGAGGGDAIAIGRADATGNNATAVGYQSNATGTDSLALRGASAGGTNSIAAGVGANASSDSGVAIGHNANSSGNSVAIGTNAIMGNSYGFAGGYNARANNDASIAIGGDVQVSSNQAIAIGTDTTIDNSSGGAVALGQDADITTSPKAVTLGQGVKATGASGGVAIGSGSSISSAAEINIGNRFKYDGTSTITLDASLIKVADSASATGSLIDNVHPAIASGSPAIKHIVTIDQTAYTTISGSGNVYDDTLYIISDATSIGVYDGSLNITGNLEVDGYITSSGNVQVDGQMYSPTFAGTIASSTSSIDFDNGNFATLNCSSATFLANPTNLKSGTTYTLIVTNGANISGYGTAWKFAGGTEPTLSANTDVITAVSDGSSLYTTALADFS